MASVPFKLVDGADFTETAGLARVEDAYFIIECQTKDAFTGTLYESGLKEIAVHLGEVTAVDFKLGLFGGAKLAVRTRTAAALEGLKTKRPGEVILKVKKAEAYALEELAELLQYYVDHPDAAWGDEVPDSGEY